MKDRPDAADPEDIARKLAAAPGLKVPPQAEWILDSDGRIKDMIWPGMTFARKLRNFIGMVSFNMIVTYIPSHVIRQSWLRLFGATIGKGSSIMRGTTVYDVEFLTVGNNSAIGFRCFLDSRGGIYIGDNVSIASDTQILGGGHDINHPDFPPVPIPTVIEDYAWIASRAMILPCHIGRGAVVAAQSVVNKDVAALDVVGGIPAKVIGKRDPGALQYSGHFRMPLF